MIRSYNSKGKVFLALLVSVEYPISSTEKDINICSWFAQ